MKYRSKYLLQTLLILCIIILINFAGKSIRFRLDLTKEKRYTLSSETKDILKNMDEQVFIRILLDGNLNIQLKDFQNNITDILDEFRIYAGNNIQYEVADPFENINANKKNKVLEELYDKGLRPVNIHHRKKDGSITKKIIIPGAIVSFNGAEIPLNLLHNDPAKSSEENLNNSIESLEYTLISTIKNITSSEVEKVAFIDGHGEWPDMLISDIMQELSKSYQVDIGRIGGSPGILDPYKCIIIAGPITPFNEKDKFVIDQYIMKGGKVLWLLDGVRVNYDSLATGMTLAYPNNLNLEDMLFRYGVRINQELIKDEQCNAIKVNVAIGDNPPNYQLAPWLYDPIITPNQKHVVGTNTTPVLLRFANNIDTIEGRSDIKKTPLLTSSVNSDLVQIPAVISLNEINTAPEDLNMTKKNLLAGVLLEGSFESVFKNRMLDNYFEGKSPKVIEKSQPTRMAVIADADIIRNDVLKTQEGPSVLPLGFDRTTNQTFGNKDFLVNLVSYLTDNTNLLTLRGRDFQLRLLDKSKITNQRLKWQLINLLIPVLIVIALGIVYSFIRKHRYTR